MGDELYRFTALPGHPLTEQSRFFHHEADTTPMAVTSARHHIIQPTRTLCDAWRQADSATAISSVVVPKSRNSPPSTAWLCITILDDHSHCLLATTDTATPMLLKESSLSRIGSGYQLCYNTPLCVPPPSLATPQGVYSLKIGINRTDAASASQSLSGSTTSTDRKTLQPENISLRGVLLDTREHGAGTYMMYAGTRTVVGIDVGETGVPEMAHVYVLHTPHSIIYQRFANSIDPPALESAAALRHGPPSILPIGADLSLGGGGGRMTTGPANAVVTAHNQASKFIGSTLPVFRSNARSLLESAQSAIQLAEENNIKAGNSLTSAERSLQRWREEEDERTDKPTSQGEEAAEAITANAAEERLTRHTTRADEDIAESRTRLKTAQRILRRWTTNAKRYRAARSKQRRLNRARGIVGITIPKLDKSGFKAGLTRFKAVRNAYRAVKKRRATIDKRIKETTKERKQALKERKKSALQEKKEEEEAKDEKEDEKKKDDSKDDDEEARRKRRREQEDEDEEKRRKRRREEQEEEEKRARKRREDEQDDRRRELEELRREMRRQTDAQKDTTKAQEKGTEAVEERTGLARDRLEREAEERGRLEAERKAFDEERRRFLEQLQQQQRPAPSVPTVVVAPSPASFQDPASAELVRREEILERRESELEQLMRDERSARDREREAEARRELKSTCEREVDQLRSRIAMLERSLRTSGATVPLDQSGTGIPPPPPPPPDTRRAAVTERLSAQIYQSDSTSISSPMMMVASMCTTGIVRAGHKNKVPLVLKI